MGLQNEEPDGETLAKYRLKRDGGLDWYSMGMSANQMSERRMYLRKILLQYPRLANMSNADLDDVRLYSVHNGYIFEDSIGREFFLKPERVTQEESDFRRCRAMIPFEFMGLTGKDFCWDRYQADISEARDMINKYTVQYVQFKERGIGLYIYSGTKGSGKTMLSCCLINEIKAQYRKREVCQYSGFH